MKNLSKKQKDIVNSIIAEFQQQNESESSNDMVAYINRELNTSKQRLHEAKMKSDALRVMIEESIAEIVIKSRDLANKFGYKFHCVEHLSKLNNADNIIEYTEIWVEGAQSIKIYPKQCIWVEGHLFYNECELTALRGGRSTHEVDVVKAIANQIIELKKKENN